jgi:hypothetical protein
MCAAFGTVWIGFEILLLKFCLGNLVTNFDLGGLVWELWVVSFGLGTKV